jgi:hypothetical protein
LAEFFVEDDEFLGLLVDRILLGRFKFITQACKNALNTLLVRRLGHDCADLTDLEVTIECLAISHEFFKVVLFFIAVE